MLIGTLFAFALILFARFFFLSCYVSYRKADSSRATHKEGVGLGLYIVKTILNTYKEDITVTSEDGYTEFTFTLSEV